LIGSIEAERQLQTYLQDKRQSVRAELLEAINPLYFPEFRSLVCQGTCLEPQIAARVADLAPLRSLEEISRLNLSGTHVESLDDISHIEGIVSLNLSETPMSDISVVAAFEMLEELDISFTDVRDLAPVSHLKNLVFLRADYTPVDDVSCILESQSIRELYVRRTRVDVNSLMPLRRDMLVFVEE
jgi:hypothetical protein